MHPLSFDPIIADAYRQAALEGRDMYIFAGQMDRLKTALAPEPDLYKQWDRLDDLIGEALWTAQDTAHLQLARRLFIDALNDAFAKAVLLPDATPDDDWACWRTAFSEASFHWQVEAMQALCEAPAFRQRFGERLERYRQFIRHFSDRRWVETRALFAELAGDRLYCDEHRGYHQYVCGQIDLYFHYDYKQAKTLFAEAEKLLSGKPLAFHGWIEYYLKSAEKDPDRAAEYAGKALGLDANHAPSLVQKADVLADKGQLAEAENLYLQARAGRPGYATPYTRLIDLYGKPELFEKKVADIERLLALDTELDPATHYLTWGDTGALFQQHGEAWWPKALYYLRKAQELDPRGIMPALNLGYFYLDTGRPEEALEFFQQVTSRAPEAREGYLALARYDEAKSNWASAAENYRRVQAIIPSWERFMESAAGRCLRQLELWADAETALLKAWSLDEYDDSGAMTELYELAQQYYKHPDTPDADRAVDLLRRAAEIRPGTPGIAAGIANRQGHALFYVERYTEALPYYERAAAIMPNEPVYYTNQADCHDKLYRQTKEDVYFHRALDALDKAAQLAPQDSAIPKKRRQLALVRYNPHLGQLPPLYQVHIEVGHPLLDQITTDFQTLLPEMTALTDALRQRMAARFGINLPGLRYRDIPEGDGAFQFRLYETPVLRDHLTVSPDNPPAMGAVLEHLEWFITHYCLDLFINYWDVDKEVPLLPNAELVHFTRVVMALLAEQTPLPALPQLHQYYRRLDGPRLPVAEAVEQLRLHEALRPHLPGTAQEYRYCPLGEPEEQLLRDCLIGQGAKHALAMPFDAARGLLGAVVRLAEENGDQKIALVVQQADVRPFLRSILTGLPWVPVLKTAELPGDAQARTFAPLRIAEQDAGLFNAALQKFYQQHTPGPGKP